MVMLLSGMLLVLELLVVVWMCFFFNTVSTLDL
jgi:hypothetical protein